MRDKALKVVKNTKHDGYQRGLTSIVSKFFDKKSVGSGIKSMSNQKKLENEPIIRKFFKKEFILYLQTIFGCLAYMQLLSKYNRKSGFIVCS